MLGIFPAQRENICSKEETMLYRNLFQICYNSEDHVCVQELAHFSDMWHIIDNVFIW